MSPVAASVLYPAVPWDHETMWPGKPNPPTAAGTTTARDTAVTDNQFGWYTQHVGAFDAGAGGIRQLQQASGRWCARTTTLALADTRAWFRRFTTWTPQLDRTTCPTDSDPAQRLAWFRFSVLAGLDTAAGATVDALGVSIIADNGLAFSPTTWLASLAGGFGIFKDAGAGTWRYASYSAAPALLETIALPSADGWHVADFIFRQAVRGDATTPWLTFRWDGVAQFTERAFGHAALPAPTTLRANSHGWAFMLGNHLQTGDMSFAMECRQGARTPEGVPILR